MASCLKTLEEIGRMNELSFMDGLKLLNFRIRPTTGKHLSPGMKI
jgi:hypothetical protein